MLPAVTALAVPAIIGAIHPSTDLVLIDPRNPSRQHVSTFCFALNREGARVFDETVEELRPFMAEGPMDPEQRFRHILASVPSEVRVRLQLHLGPWRTPWTWGGLTAETPRSLVVKKAASAVFEYLLTINILRRGGVLIPVNHDIIFRTIARARRTVRWWTR
jgi:hypothetical protein